jgi:hypothetical protein
MSTMTPKGALAVDFEKYAAQRGASRCDVGDAGTHMRGQRQTDKQWRRLLACEANRTDKVLSHRAELRSEYDELVRAGEIRPLTQYERLQVAAAGHPDRESTQAARRILAAMEDTRHD